MAERRRLRRHKAPQLILDATAWRLDPRRHALQRLRRGDTLCEQDVVHLALRREQAIPGGYDFIGWLMDDAGRSTDPAVDLWDVVDPEVRAALFGSDVLRVDGVPALGEARAWVHAPEAIPAVARRLLGLLDRPPPLLIYRAWYRPLHALRFALDDDACVPPRGRLAWEYATELAHARRAITALGRTLASATRRGWCWQILSESPSARAADTGVSNTGQPRGRARDVAAKGARHRSCSGDRRS